MTDAAPDQEDPFLAQLQRELLGAPVATGREQMSRLADLDAPLVGEFWHALGFPVAQADSGAFAEADVWALGLVSELVSSGRVDHDLLLAMTRAVARSTDRLSVWQSQLVAEYLLGDTASDQGVDRATAIQAARQLSAFAGVFEPLLTYAWRRHLLAALTRMVADAGPEVVEENELAPAGESTAWASGPRRVVGFADLVNFSAHVRRATERELSVMVVRFERLASDIVTAHGGRVIKTVGDEVLFVAVEPLSGAAIGLDLVQAMAEDEVLPEVRVGLAYGPVLARLGDVFGTTVNRASRLTAVAGSGRVLADEALSAALAQTSGFTLRTGRRRLLRGVGAVTPREVLRSRGERRQ